jgi:hypothetical protein
MSAGGVKFWTVAVFQYDFVSSSITLIKSVHFYICMLIGMADSGRRNGSSSPTWRPTKQHQWR